VSHGARSGPKREKILGITQSQHCGEPKLRYGMHRHGTKTENAMEQQHKSQDQEMEALRKQQHFAGAGSATRNTNNTM